MQGSAWLAVPGSTLMAQNGEEPLVSLDITTSVYLCQLANLLILEICICPITSEALLIHISGIYLV